MDWIYLDNNATTQPAPEVLDALDRANRELWANPSSVHRFGQAVRQQVELARAELASLIGAKPADLIFTSCGTESNNLAIRGLLEHTLYRDAKQRGALITTPIEHAAVREPAEALEKAGGQVVRLPVNHLGLIDPRKLQQTLLDVAGEADIILASIQWANNETGVIQPVEQIVAAVHSARETLVSEGCRAKLYLHVDATQAVGKLPVDLAQLPIDLLTLSAHKFHGPKGVAALYVRRGARIRPQLRGGPQEREKRGGTENAPGIIAIGVAGKLAREFLADAEAVARITALRDRLERGLLAVYPHAVVNGEGAERLWNTANVAFPPLEAEAILLGLSERGICASAGAACSSGSLEPSPILLAMHLPEPVAHGSVRFSLSRFTTEAEIDAALAHVPAVIHKLAKAMPGPVA